MKKQPLFIADEGVEKEIVVTLRQDYDVLYVAESMQGANDDMILEQANNTGRILVTLDKDFGELVFRLQQLHTGVVLCRLQGLTIEEKCLLVKNTINNYESELLHSFTVIQPKNIRIRKK
jgi:predicted nuclease of predicted toxin-antitoxin system